MKNSILNGKKILAVDDEPDVLNILEEEILEDCPEAKIDKATTYEAAANLLKTQNYDVVVLDIMGVRGFDLLNLAIRRSIPAAMLTAHALTPEALKESIELGARAYLPKEKLGEIVPFLEDVLEEKEYLSGWSRLMNKLEGYFNNRWGEYWQKKEEKFWEEFNNKTLNIKW
jgi:DNA-binding response OmpR family regulator